MKKLYSIIALLALLAGNARGQESTPNYLISLSKKSTVAEVTATAQTASATGTPIMLKLPGHSNAWLKCPATDTGTNLTFTITQPAFRDNVTDLLFTLVAVDGETDVYYLKAPNNEYLSGEITTQSSLIGTNGGAVATSSENKAKFTVVLQDGKFLLRRNGINATIHLNIQDDWYNKSQVNYWQGIGGYSQWEVYIPETSKNEITLLTSLDNISTDNKYATYTIQPQDIDRGYLYSDTENHRLDACGGKSDKSANRSIAHNPEDVNQRFAFIEKDGNYYLYSVADKRFATWSSSNNAVSPLAETVYSGQNTVAFQTADGGNNYVIVKIGSGSTPGWINFSPNYDVDIYMNWRNQDVGNKLWVIQTDTPLTEDEYNEALAKIINTVNVTYQVVDANNTNDIWATATVAQVPNSAISMPSQFSNPFVTLSEVSGTIGTVDTTITYQGSLNTGWLSPSYDNATWYYLKVRENQSNIATKYIAYNATTTPYPNSTNKTVGHAGQWAFVGSVPDDFNPYDNEINGVKIYNRATGASETLKTTDTPTLAEGDDDSEWVLGKNTMGFTFHISGTGKYLHDLSDKLSYWDAGAAKNDGGSAFTIEEVPAATELVASEIEPYYNAMGYFSFTDDAKQELVSAGYKAKETSYSYSDAEFNSIYGKLTELIADASNLTLPETGYYRIKSSGTAKQGTVGYIGFGKSNENNDRGPGLKTITTSYNTDASTVLHLNRTDNNANTYTISTQGVWATRATDLNQPVLYTTNKDEAATFTFAPVTNNPTYAGFGTIQQDTKVNDKYGFFHEAGWGTDKSCVCVWEAGATNTPSFWQIEEVNDGDIVYSTALHDAGDGRYYATTYLPFPSRIRTEGVTAYIGILDETKGSMQLTEVVGTIPAFTGVVLVGNSDATVEFVLSIADDAAELSNNDLSGVTIATDVTADGTQLSLGKADGAVGFYHWGGTLVNKAYLDVSLLNTLVSSKGFAFSFDDVTGISADFVREAVLNLQQPIYNIQGQRVDADYKGIVIQDGKKFLQK